MGGFLVIGREGSGESACWFGLVFKLGCLIVCSSLFCSVLTPFCLKYSVLGKSMRDDMFFVCMYIDK